jgi:DNA-binding NarL/FixJ family response regulator
MLIDTQDDMEVVGEASTAAECVKLAPPLDPDVVVLDISMPGGSGIGAIETLRKSGSRSRVLVLTMHEEAAYVRTALAAGAAGYVTKDATPAEILGAIRSVSRGRSHLAVPLSTATLDDILSRGPGRDSAVGGPTDVLSPRELEVLRFVAQGFTSREVAERLELSVKTVESYRARLGGKLGLRSRADLVRYALESGVLNDEGSTAPGGGGETESS